MQRLLIVCRHFWPVANAASYRVAELIRFLHELQVQVELLTMRWHTSWPSRSEFHEVPMTRVTPASTSVWNDGNAYRNIWAWAERHCEQLDAILVDSVEMIAGVKLSSSLKQKRFLIRVDLANPRDRHVLNRPSATLQWLMKATNALFLISNAADHRVLLGMGVSAARVLRAETVLNTTQRSVEIKREARHTLATLGVDFVVSDAAPLVVAFFEGLDHAVETECLRDFVSALHSGKSFRAWVFGANDLVRRHHAFVKEQGFHHDVLFHSSFDDMKLIYDSADLIVSPIIRDAKDFYYPQAIARGVATMYSQLLATRDPAFTSNQSPLELIHSFKPGKSDSGDLFEHFLNGSNSFEASALKLWRQMDWLKYQEKQNSFWRQVLANS